jgi:hypothetical protein
LFSSSFSLSFNLGYCITTAEVGRLTLTSDIWIEPADEPASHTFAVDCKEEKMDNFNWMIK